MTELSHKYDPVKAREYYLRTRKLKGRKKGTTTPPKKTKTSARKANTAKLKKAANERNKKVAALSKKAANLRLQLQAEMQNYATGTKIPANVSPAVRAILQRRKATQAKETQRSRQEKALKAKEIQTAIDKARKKYESIRRKLSAK